MTWKRILVIGAGGTGSLLLPSLSRFLFSQKFEGELIIADGDHYSESNIERQNFALKFVGENKAEYQYNLICAHMPDFQDRCNFIKTYLGSDDVNKLVDNGTIIINCADNKAIRKLVEDRCLTLDNVAHICCGNEMRTGQAQISLRMGGQQITPSIYQHFPDLNEMDGDRSKMDCLQLAQLPSGGQIIVANNWAASFALGYVVKLMSTHPLFSDNWFPSSGIVFDAFTDSFEVLDKQEVRPRKKKAVAP